MSRTTFGGPHFRTEIGLRPPGLTDSVRRLDACLRSAQPGDFTVEEEQALAALLRTVERLTEASRFCPED